LYKVITYHDRSGEDKISEYINTLDKQSLTNKDARIRYNKIIEYIGKLERNGTREGEPTIKHITGTDLWELRPIDDRIFFVYWKNDIFVLLHHFAKKTQRTPRREINQALRNLNDFIERFGK
jgi:phage-related protein